MSLSPLLLLIDDVFAPCVGAGGAAHQRIFLINLEALFEGRAAYLGRGLDLLLGVGGGVGFLVLDAEACMIGVGEDYVF